jgi:hypothetical protein
MRDVLQRTPQRTRSTVIAGALVAALVLVLVAAQLALPAMAAHRVRAALGPQATGVHVRVEALPAIQLLWHRADRVTIDVGHLSPSTSSRGTVGDLLASLRVARRLDLRVGSLQTHGVELRGVTVHKDGDVVVGHADADFRSLARSLPAGLRVRSLAGRSGEIALQGRLSALGRSISAPATLTASNGRIVVRPAGIGLLSIPVFSDDRIAVDTLGGEPVPGGLTLNARAHLL